jgi:hypothetical protein
MKKILLLCFILSATLAEAQTFIPKAGISLAEIDAEDNTGVKQRLGLSLGIAYNMPIKGAFSFQPELLFVQKGAKLDYSISEPGFFKVDLSGKIIINYIEVPLLVHANLPTNSSNLKFYLAAGPAVAIGLGGKTEINLYVEEDGDVIIDEKISGSVKFGDQPANDESGDAYIKRVEISAQIGAGFIIKDKFIVDFRYGVGFTNLYDDEKSKNKVFQATIGMPLMRK